MTVGYLTASASRQGGGLFDAVRRLAHESIHSAGLSVTALALDDTYSSQDRPAWDGVPLRTFPVAGPRFLGYAPDLLAAMDAAGVDLVHQHGIWMYPSVASLRWARRTRRPYLISPHGMLDGWALKNSEWKKKLAGWAYQDAHLRGAACIHALCQAEVEAIRDYGLRNPVCVVPNGVDLPVPADNASPAIAGCSTKDGKVLLYVGRLHTKKNLLNLLRAWAQLRRDSRGARSWRLVIAGWDQDGHERALKSAAAELAPAESVEFAGPQFGQDKATLFRRADAFILPSCSEGLPMAVLEAWSYGLPVVMTPECNLPEGFRAEAAIRIGTAPEHIARGLDELVLLNDSHLRRMGRNGENLVRARYAWPIVARKMKEVYKWILGGSPPSALEIS